MIETNDESERSVLAARHDDDIYKQESLSDKHAGKKMAVTEHDWFYVNDIQI